MNKKRLGWWIVAIYCGLVIIFSNQIIEFMNNLGFSNPAANLVIIVVSVLFVAYNSRIVERIVK